MSIAVVPHRVEENGGTEHELTGDSLVTAAVWNAEDAHSDLSDISVVHQGVRIADLPELVGTTSGDVRCALRLDSPRRSRRNAVSLFQSLEGLGHVTGVDEPIAAFANNWYHDRTHDPDRPLRIVAVARRESCTLVVGHTGRQRLVAVGLATTPEHIRKLAETGARYSQEPLSIDVPLRWHSTLSAVGSVATFGLDPGRRNEFDNLFGPLVSHKDFLGILHGLTRMSSLASWAACWPTVRVQLGSGWTRQPGPLRDRVEEHVARLRPGADILFSDSDGRLLPVRAGSVTAQGCVIPHRLGTQPRLQFIDDGRLFLWGPTNTHPLAMAISWPIPASGATSIEVRSAGPSGVELADPFVELPRGAGSSPQMAAR